MANANNKFIIKYSNDIASSDSPKDAHVELGKSDCGHNIIKVRSKKLESDNSNIVYLNKLITKDFPNVKFDDYNLECVLEYTNCYSSLNPVNKSRIKFDNASSGAYTKFKTNLEEMVNTTIETVTYANGRIFYIGEILNKNGQRVPNNKGTFYYNGVKRRPKYNGECENGKYDGQGIFYSYDGKLSISANNISKGIPNSKGKLKIGFKGINEVIEIDFGEFFDKYYNHSKECKQEFVRSDNFVKFVTDKYWYNNEPIDRVIFRDHTIEDKHDELWDKINKLNIEVECMRIQNKVLAEKNYHKNQKLVIMSTLFIIFIHTLLFMLYK